MKNYLTTPIYYVNAAPHIGHAHTSTMADILKRNRRMLGWDVRLSTGCDEHGQKNQEAAEKSGLTPQAYLDQRSEEFRKVFDLLQVEYDYFVRTTRPAHKAEVAAAEQRLFDAGLIVQKQYSGNYCPGCEQFKKDSDLNEEGRCPDHPSIDLQQIDETNYFFKLEPFRQRLIDHIEANPDFVDPPVYRGELLQMLRDPLEDLSISRPKARVTLGIELPFDTSHVTYVWFDALLNYLTNLDWPAPGYEEWWAQSHHLIGKDILKTHGVYWPIMLMALGIPLPRQLVVHGHWLGEGGVKMSKTLGNVVDPIEVVEAWGSDALRYYLARNMRSDSDSQISMDSIRQTYNAELVNKFGNLLSRVGKFARARFEGAVPAPGAFDADDEAMRALTLAAVSKFAVPIRLAELPACLAALVEACDELNGYVARNAPWDLFKDPATMERCRSVIYVALDCQRLLFEAMRIITPTAADKALAMLRPGAPTESIWTPALGIMTAGDALGEIETLFPRAD